MKILINISNLVKGGAIQVAKSFIEELDSDSRGYEYLVLCSKVLYSEMAQRLQKEDIVLYRIKNKVSLFGFSARKELSQIERKFNPDVVFSVFGPTYWKPKTRHLVGYAIPHYIYADVSPFFEKLDLFEKIKLKLRKEIKKILLKNSADFYVTETEDASNRLAAYLKINRLKIYTVSNTYHQVFLNSKINCEKFDFLDNDKRTKLLTVSAYYPHKNLGIIKSVLDLMGKDSEVIFVTTLPKKDFEHFKGYEDRILNVGPTDINYVPCLYQKCDFMFLPTLLECFSASYTEAMITGKPILTSNLPFATEICQEAALYFDPLDAADIKNTISKALDNEIYRSLQLNGKKRLGFFETSASRARKYISILEQIRTIS
ncbi:glycosyltransferase [Flagellimonas sp. HMM57]|uniref:glycosyltransferase n=1 Tax=unclassified Flagellimonas TaxID=2644544 RepID=UPI0013D582AC|nr:MULTISPECIES: glycosyltransferase [unclassified Flagellimonas]UII77600.1 glycosyltransferase [Flagellimonas sp. HMM57]